MYFPVAGERKGVKLTTNGPLLSRLRHAHHHAEEDIVEHPETRRPNIYNHRSTPRAATERRVREKTGCVSKRRAYIYLKK